MLLLQQFCVCMPSNLVMSDPLQPYGLLPTRILCSKNFPGKNTGVGEKKKKKNPGVGCYFLLKGIFLTQGSKPDLFQLLQWKEYSLPLSHLGKPSVTSVKYKWISSDYLKKLETRIAIYSKFQTNFVLKTYYSSSTVWHFYYN